jgi:hypothetical protein
MPGGGAGHEGGELHPHDEDIRKIVLAGSSVAAITVIASVMLFWLFGAFMRRELERDPPPHPMFEQTPLTPEPRLQAAPAEDLLRLREEEQTLLTTYDWVDREAKVVRIPVERAAELLLQRGLPVRAR